MGFSGDVHRLLFKTGGFNANPNVDELPDTSMLVGSKNVNLHSGGRQKRGGTAFDFTAISGTSITGLHHFAKRNGDVFLPFTTGNGKIYSRPSTVLKTGLATNKISSFTTYLNSVYIMNVANKVQVWDGVAGSTSDLGNYPADWGTGSPLQIVVHGRQNSLRAFAIGVTGFENNLYASALDSDDFGTSPLVFNIETGAPYGIRGAVEFGNRLILFSRDRAYILEDTDPSTANWGYSGAQWIGGVASYRLIVRLPNDVICMTEDGEIYSVTAAQSYGDYKAASISKPSFINNWIKSNVDLTVARTKFHAVYDPILRAVKFFVVRSGQTTVDTALVFFTDRDPSEAWSIHSDTSVSGYRAQASAYAQDSNAAFTVLTGDYAGQVWRHEQNTLKDNNSAYTVTFLTPSMSFGDPRTQKKYKRVHFVSNIIDASTIRVKVYIDGEQRSDNTVDVPPLGATIGSAIFGTSIFGAASLPTLTSQVEAIGTRIQFEVSNDVVDEEFFITQMMIDYRMLGRKAGWSK